jgi:hypothetical protein
MAGSPRWLQADYVYRYGHYSGNCSCIPSNGTISGGSHRECTERICYSDCGRHPVQSVMVSFTVTPLLMSRFGNHARRYTSYDFRTVLQAGIENVFDSVKNWYANVLGCRIKAQSNHPGAWNNINTYSIASFALITNRIYRFCLYARNRQR